MLTVVFACLYLAVAEGRKRAQGRDRADFTPNLHSDWNCERPSPAIGRGDPKGGKRFAKEVAGYSGNDAVAEDGEASGRSFRVAESTSISRRIAASNQLTPLNARETPASKTRPGRPRPRSKSTRSRPGGPINVEVIRLNLERRSASTLSKPARSLTNAAATDVLILSLHLDPHDSGAGVASRVGALNHDVVPATPCGSHLCPQSDGQVIDDAPVLR